MAGEKVLNWILVQHCGENVPDHGYTVSEAIADLDALVRERDEARKMPECMRELLIYLRKPHWYEKDFKKLLPAVEAHYKEKP